LNPDLAMVLSLRRVLESARNGKGMSRSIIEELGSALPPYSEPARILLLGFPLSASLKPLTEDGSQEVAMLASLIVSAPKSSATLVGSSGEALATTLERWVKIKESAKLEQKVLRFRSIVTSAVLGAVTAMVASLGPIVGNLNFTALTAARPEALLPAAAGMAAVSSGMLGLFMSGRRFYVNVAVSLAVFVAVSAITSPLVNIPNLTPWGVK
jgi:hypothetical protein